MFSGLDVECGSLVGKAMFFNANFKVFSIEIRMRKLRRLTFLAKNIYIYIYIYIY